MGYKLRLAPAQLLNRSVRFTRTSQQSRLKKALLVKPERRLCGAFPLLYNPSALGTNSRQVGLAVRRHPHAMPSTARHVLLDRQPKLFKLSGEVCVCHSLRFMRGGGILGSRLPPRHRECPVSILRPRQAVQLP